jgi:TatD DNase family protein
MQLIDTHCHIHESTYPLNAIEVLQRARAVGVDKMICVGTSQQSSCDALAFAARHEGVFVSIGVHPHDTKDGWEKIKVLTESTISTNALMQSSRLPGYITDTLEAKSELTSGPNSDLARSSVSDIPRQEGEQANRKLVAIGEIGLDYFYTHSPRDVQIQALEAQIALALQYKLPIIFHVRDAFDDFWPIFDNFHGIRGVLHSFTDTAANIEQGLSRGLLIGVNGISTFTKDKAQQQMFANIPLGSLLLETDAPFLTPAPFRGKVNEPAFVAKIAAYNAYIRGISTEEVAAITTANADALFALP